PMRLEMRMHVETLRVAAAQMCSGPDIPANLAQADTLIAQARRDGAGLVVLPENFAVFGRKDLASCAEMSDTPGPILGFLAERSRHYGLWLVAGTLPYATGTDGRLAPNRVFPGCGVWTPEGVCTARYDKCHLFDVDVADGMGRYRESDQFAAGSGPVVVNTPWGALGLSICYDLRFPEYYRLLGERGALMLAVPSAFTYNTGEAHWEVLLRARAIENQCFVLAANQGGDHANNRRTWGHSCVIDPWGKLLAGRTEPGPGLAIADLDFSAQAELRSKMPVLGHRRF
ncbi:MAG TPA: carbon-nitrogen hydrolase family protein, partial [Halioglobus sp.]